MFQDIDTFANIWTQEAAATLDVFQELSDDALLQRVTAEGRTLGFIAWHITTSISSRLSLAGLDVHVTVEDAPIPASARQIVSTYEMGSSVVCGAVRSRWSDGTLSDPVALCGGFRTRGGVLFSLILHQCHHRGQMTILMQRAGLRVPALYPIGREEYNFWGAECPV